MKTYLPTSLRSFGPGSGRAYKFLLDLRLDEGELGPEEAERRLRAWAAATL